MTTPFGVSDEFAHFWRACDVSEGNPLAHTPPGGGYRGDSLPRSEEQIGDMLMHYRSVRIPSTHIDWQGWHRAWRIGFAPQDRVFLSFPATAAYSPVAYLPAALAIALSRECHLSVLAAFYLARLSNVIVVAALVGYAWRRLPYARESCALTMMLPMTLSQIGSLSIDSISFGVAFLWIALVLCLAQTKNRSTRGWWREHLELFAVAIVLGQTKFFFPLALLAFLPFIDRENQQRATLVAAVQALGLALVSGALWAIASSSLSTPTRLDIVASPALQTAFLREHPVQFLEICLRTLQGSLGTYGRQIVGVLGWLQIQLPSWLYLGTWIALIASTGFQSRGKVSARMRLFFLGLALIFLLSVYSAVYEKWNAIGAPFIEGVQGRYLILMLPLLAMARMSRLWSYWRAERPVRIGLYTLAVAANICALTIQFREAFG